MLCAALSRQRDPVRPCEKRAWSAKRPQSLFAITRTGSVVSTITEDVLGCRISQLGCNRMACQRSATVIILVRFLSSNRRGLSWWLSVCAEKEDGHKSEGEDEEKKKSATCAGGNHG
jgi:hypothetical protein